jgi:lipopolysaccharide heptosyltransferase I
LNASGGALAEGRTPARIVLVRLSAVGDIVHTWPLATALRDALPRAQLTWVVEEPLRLLVEGHPCLDGIVVVNTRRWRRAPFSSATRTHVTAVRRRLRDLDADLAIDAQGLLKSAIVTHWIGAPRRVGLRRPWRRELLAGFAYNETVPGSVSSSHVVATNLELVRAVGTEPPAEPPPPDGRWLARRALERPVRGPWSSPYAVLLVGAGRQGKVLPVSTQSTVAADLARQGLGVVLAWGPGELDAASALARATGGSAVVAPPTDLLQLAGLLAEAALVIGSDTGPLHLAASLGTPTVGVFLTTSPLRNGPIGPRVAAVSAVVELPPRTGSARARPVRAVTACEVLTAARRVLAGQSAPGFTQK